MLHTNLIGCQGKVNKDKKVQYIKLCRMLRNVMNVDMQNMCETTCHHDSVKEIYKGITPKVLQNRFCEIC